MYSLLDFTILVSCNVEFKPVFKFGKWNKETQKV